MGWCRIRPWALPLAFVLATAPASLTGQTESRIWGRVHTVSAEIHEGFIRWDRNEGSWSDLLNGYKDTVPFQFVDWWELSHPGDSSRDRVVELAGYRITWDDAEPEFPSSVESGVRFGHVARLTVTGEDRALLVFRRGTPVELEGGSTDLGSDLREIRVGVPGEEEVELEWEDLASVEFFQAPEEARAQEERLHGTVELKEAGTYTGFIAWDVNKIFTSDLLVGEDDRGRRRDIPFSRVQSIGPSGEGALIRLAGGEEIYLSGRDDVDDGNDGIQVSDPGLGLVDADWEDLVEARFHPPSRTLSLAHFTGGERLVGTVLTRDSSEVEGWIRWDGDEEFAWELLDGYHEGVSFDVEFGQISSIEIELAGSVTSETTPEGVDLHARPTESTAVTLRDGRVLELTGSNDVDESNHGVFVLPQGGGFSPDDPEAEWIMVRWGDFLSIRFHWEEGP